MSLGGCPLTSPVVLALLLAPCSAALLQPPLPLPLLRKALKISLQALALALVLVLVLVLVLMLVLVLVLVLVLAAAGAIHVAFCGACMHAVAKTGAVRCLRSVVSSGQLAALASCQPTPFSCKTAYSLRQTAYGLSWPSV